MLIDDHELLRQYVEGKSESAFTSLLERYVNFVYSAALRQVRSPDLAKDVTQAVFLDFARKARFCREPTVIAGWLHRATFYEASRLIRTEVRRKAREQEAMAMQNQGEEANWERMQPEVDGALQKLNRKNRDALILRIFEQRSLREVGEILGCGEEAARKRVARALEQLRELLRKRGLFASTAGLAAVLGVHGVEAAPAGLSTTLSVAVATGGGAKASGGVGLFLLKAITMTKIQTGIIGALMIAAVSVPVALHLQRGAKLRAENERQPVNNATVPKRGEWQIGQVKSSAELMNVGFGSPESTAQTMLWSMANAVADTYIQSLKRPANVTMPNKDQMAQVVGSAKRDMDRVTGFQLDSVEVLNPQRSTVRITLQRGNEHKSRVTFVLEQVGQEWKIKSQPETGVAMFEEVVSPATKP